MCDGRDNDCNGLVDNGAVMGVGAACGPSTMGVCRQGTNVCERGVLRCVGATTPGTEFCNGLDDNCDGAVDEGCLRTLGAELRLDRGAAFNSIQPTIVGEGRNLGVAFLDRRSGEADMYFTRSADNGASWAGDLRLDTDAMGSHASEEPSVAADAAGNVYAAWQDVRTGMAYDIYFNRSTDGGATWLPADIRLDTDTFAQDSIRPECMALPARGVAVVWVDRRADDTTGDIYYRRFTR